MIDHESGDSTERPETLPMRETDNTAKPTEAPSTSHDAEQVGHTEAMPISPEEEAKEPAEATASGYQAAQPERAEASLRSHPAEQVGHADATAVSRLAAADADKRRDEAADRGEELQNTLDMIELSAGSRPLGSLLLGFALGAGIVAAGLLAFAAVFVLLVGVIR